MAHGNGPDKEANVSNSTGAWLVQPDPLKMDKGMRHKLRWRLDPNLGYSFLSPADKAIKIRDATTNAAKSLSDPQLFDDVKLKNNGLTLELKNENPQRQRYIYDLFVIRNGSAAVEKVTTIRIKKVILNRDGTIASSDVEIIDPIIDNEG